MWNVMKAMNYQIKRDILTPIIIMVALGIPIVSLFLDAPVSISEMSGGIAMALCGENMPMFMGIIVLFFTARICGWDQADKTMNYEVLSGHSRAEVFFGRVIMSFIWVGCTAILGLALPILVSTIMNGWGVNVNFADGMLRFFLIIFPLCRMICEFILLTFLLKNCYIAMAIGYVLYGVSNVASLIFAEVTNYKLTTQLGYINLMNLLSFSNSRMEYIEGKDVLIYDSSLSLSFIFGTIGVSLTIGFICLLLGYIYLRKQDIH